MAYTPNEVKQGRPRTEGAFREETDDFSLVLMIRFPDSFGRRISVETTWNFCIGAFFR
jgi:hypothetical protein